MIFIDKGSDSVTYFGGEIAVLSVDLDKINLDDVNLMKMILKLLFMPDA